MRQLAEDMDLDAAPGADWKRRYSPIASTP